MLTKGRPDAVKGAPSTFRASDALARG